MDSDSSEHESEVKDDSDYDGTVLQPGIRHMGLAESYSPLWSLRDAFREFYQNW